MINRHKQKGAETVEFAMIALLFFAVLFAIIEFSRAMFVWNALSEATRRGARMAVICPVGSDVPKQVAIFKHAITGSGDTIIPGLATGNGNVAVNYYLEDGVTPSLDPALVKFVQVSIAGYTHQLIIPLWGRPLPAPTFTTTLPTESLGAVPTNPGAKCPDGTNAPCKPDCKF
jgi:hypothetical protein